MNWTAIENAIYVWVSTASGLTTIWSGQDSPTPTGAFVAMRFEEIANNGVDANWSEPTAGEPAGSELTFNTLGWRRAVLSLTYFPGTATGSGAAMGVLEKVALYARKPSQNALLNAAGVGVMDFEPVRKIDGLINVIDFEPRAFMNVILSLASSTTETETVIDTAVVTRET